MLGSDVGFAADPLRDGLGDTRLADTGLARDQDAAAFAALGLRPTTHEEVNLLVPADERRGSRA